MTLPNYKKNFLKDLVYLAQTKPVHKTIIKGLFRFALEPLLEAQNQKAVVLIRMFDTTESEGVLKRLEFNQAEVYSFCDNLKGENLEREKIWGDTEFLVVLSPRYSAVLVWDYSTEDVKDTSCLYYLLNSRDVNNVIRTISANSLIDLNRYIIEFTPERRTNELLNKAVHKFIDYANNFVVEASASKAENDLLEANEELLQKYEYISNKAKLISHEIKNHLSVIDLYSRIIEKRCEKLENGDEKTSICGGINCIKKSKEMIAQMLSELKTIQVPNVLPVDLKDMLETLGEMAAPRAAEKGKELVIKNDLNAQILADEGKTLNVLLNLVYNALDFSGKEGVKGKVEVEAVSDGTNMLKILVKDNGKGVPQEAKDKIFEKGFTMKETGNGFGLYISKTSMQEQYGDLKLVEDYKDGAAFEIEVPML